MNDGLRTAAAMWRDDRSTPGVAVQSSDPALDRVVALAADLFETPAAGLVVAEGDWTRLKVVLGLDVAQLDWPLVQSLAGPVSRLVLDAALDDDLRHHPLVAGPPHVRFLATSPLPAVDGVAAGVLFVLDTVPRHSVGPDILNRLDALAAIAGDAVASRRALDVARTGSEARSRLLADVSHELRAPLNGILGFAELLKDDRDLGDDARGNLQRIEDAGRGLLSIVNDVLDVSRLESGVVRLDERPFSPARLVEDCVAMVRPEAERKGLAVSHHVSKVSTVLVLGDPDRLRQILLNLLSNAVKFTGAGSVQASLTASDSDEQVGVVSLVFTVEDSGIGIADDGIPRLFNRFVQADRSVAQRFGGSGLGLAISKTLIEAMGGTIRVESSPGVGTRFSVTLSLPRALDRPLEPPRRRRSARPRSLGDVAILLADDAPLNQKLVTQMLTPLGASVDVVADGVEAMKAVERRDYALVLMDMEMPIMGGLDATRHIRALPGKSATIPIVGLTANVYPEQLDLCRAAGMDDVLTKPFGPDDLVAVALRWSRRLKPAV